MKQNKNIPTADELRFKAKTMAYRIAEANSIDPDAVRHMTDTQIGRPCFVVTEDSNHAVVVYDHDPEVKFSILNFPGRLVPENTITPTEANSSLPTEQTT